MDNANNEAYGTYEPYEPDAEDTVRHENLQLVTRSLYDAVQVLNAELFFFHGGPETEPVQGPFQFSLITADKIFRSGIILKTKGFRTVQRIDQQNILRKFHQ